MTAEAKKHIEERFFDGYPQHELDYIGDRRLKDIADLMDSYALQIAREAVEDFKADWESGDDGHIFAVEELLSRIEKLTEES